MRADTHDGPEQMLHVRGLIHCCSSHVRRSWNSVLQRTAGPYILALLRPFGTGEECPLSAPNWTFAGCYECPLYEFPLPAVEVPVPRTPPGAPIAQRRGMHYCWIRSRP